jgi:hypothetical protein
LLIVVIQEVKLSDKSKSKSEENKEAACDCADIARDEKISELEILKQSLEEKKKAADAAAAAKRKAEQQKLAAQRADNCQRARTGLAGLQSGARIEQIDAQGERSYMTDAQRAAEIERLQGIIASDCH